MSARPSVRAAAVAGTFYPADPHRLRAEVEACLAAAAPAGAPAPRALIAPHAGYVYSGPVAGAAFRAVAGRAAEIRRVVLLGPSHYVALRGLALPRAGAFATPLGEVPLAADAAALLAGLAGVTVDDRPHAREHSLEVELPFLQVVLGDFELVPLATGEAAAEEVAAAIERLWADDATLVVVSSDLSHFLDYESARRRDRETSRAIVALDERRIGEEDACGRVPIRGLLVTARRRKLAARLLDLRNSGDTAGGRDRVVGYGAYAFA